tara:strand:- start:4564 stop:5547 length:984 start_codon:yes stop_codon:yes gene_type:complete
MKKLLLILLCLPFFGLGQTDRELLKESTLRMNLAFDRVKDKLEILEGDDEILIQDLLKKEEYSSKESAIEIHKLLYKNWRKKVLGYDIIYGLNSLPTDKKNYFELYWKTFIESFPFVDDFTFNTYRDEWDYVYAAIHDFSYKSEYTVSDFVPIYKFRRNASEVFIEALAKYTPFFLFIFFLYILYRIDVSRNLNFIKKYIYFGFVDDSKQRKMLRVFLLTIFIFPHVLTFLPSNNILNISLFMNLSSPSFGSSNEILSSGTWAFIDSPLIVEWHKVILGNICLLFVSYFLTLALYFLKIRKTVIIYILVIIILMIVFLNGNDIFRLF